MRTNIFLLICLLSVRCVAQQPSPTPFPTNGDLLRDGIEIGVKPEKPPGIASTMARMSMQVSIKNNTAEPVQFANEQLNVGEGITIYALDGAGHKTAIYPSTTRNASAGCELIRTQPGGSASVKAWLPLRLLTFPTGSYVLSVRFTRVESGKFITVVSAPFSITPPMNTQ